MSFDEKHLRQSGKNTKLISLRQGDCVNQIREFARVEPDGAALLLDGLDEAHSYFLPNLLSTIEEISSEYPRLAIYITARWVFINRYASSFPTYRFITISPFSWEDVKDYLVAEGIKEKREWQIGS